MSPRCALGRNSKQIMAGDRPFSKGNLLNISFFIFYPFRVGWPRIADTVSSLQNLECPFPFFARKNRGGFA